MKEIVERILKEERLAQERIEKARKDSEASVERKKLASQQEFVREKEAVLQKTKDDVAASIGSLSKDITGISQKIFTRIMSIEE